LGADFYDIAACRCPDLVTIPYEFDAYQEVSEAVYDILLQHSRMVQPLSCDEAYLDVSVCEDPKAVARQIRQQIAAMGCTASVGIGPSLLVARIATKKAKPDGMFRILPQVLSEDTVSCCDLQHTNS
jgi:DNA repair protein REV1